MPLKEALASLRKDIGKEALEFETNLDSLTTGSIAIDYITGIGGFPKGRLSEVFGWESSGKTTLCLTACARAQAKGLTAAYVDMERAVNLDWAARIGFIYDDIEKGLYLTPGHFEDAATAVTHLVENGTDLVVVDSVPAMTPKDILEGSYDDAHPIGLQSRLMAQFLSKVTKIVAQKGTVLVLVNQMRAKIPLNRWDTKEQAAGGSALRFYSSLRIDMEQVKQETEDAKSEFTGQPIKVVTEAHHRAQAFKNKVGTPYRKCDFWIKYGKDGVWGIDNLQTIMDVAIHRGVIEKAGGGNFSYSGANFNFALRGTAELYNYLAKPEHAELRMEIRKSCGLVKPEPK